MKSGKNPRKAIAPSVGRRSAMASEVPLPRAFDTFMTTVLVGRGLQEAANVDSDELRPYREFWKRRGPLKVDSAAAATASTRHEQGETDMDPKPISDRLKRLIEQSVDAADLPAADADDQSAVVFAGTNNTNIHVTGLSGGLHIHIHLHPPKESDSGT